MARGWYTMPGNDKTSNFGVGECPDRGKLQVYDRSAANTRQVRMWFTSDQISGSAANGLRLERRAADVTALGVSWVEDGAEVWNLGFAPTTQNLAIFGQALNQNIFEMRPDTAQAEFGPGAANPGSNSQLSVYGGTNASQKSALRTVNYGNSTSGLVMTQANAGTKRTVVSYNGGTWIVGTDMAGTNSDSFHFWNSVANATLFTITNQGKFLFNGPAGTAGLGFPNKVNKTTLTAPGTITGGIEVFDGSGNSIGSLAVYANGSLT